MEFDSFLPDANPDHDRGLFAQFFYQAVRMAFKSEQQGRDIFEDRAFVRIVTPGLSASETVREATDIDKIRFTRQWERFEKTQEQGIDGTPLEGWPVLARSQVEELKYLKFMTVEQVAGASDAQISALGAGYVTLREKAKAFLDLAKDSALAERLAADNERQANDIKDLKQQIVDLSRRFEEANRDSNKRQSVRA